MSFESLKNAAERNLNPVDFARGFIDSAVDQPLNAFRQLTGGKIAKTEPANDSLATKAGNVAGFILDFTIISKLTGRAMNPVLGSGAEGVIGTSAKMGAAGAMYGGLL